VIDVLCGSEPSRRWFRHSWSVAAAAIVLFAVHGIILHYIWSHALVSTTAVIGIIAVILIKHLGLFGSAFAGLRRYLRDRR
jgi:hypothetical protein